MKTKRNRMVINIALIFFLVCGISIVSMALINNLFTRELPLADNQQGIKEEAGAGEGLLVSTSDREATVTAADVVDDDGVVIGEIHIEVLSASTAFGNLDPDLNVTGWYGYYASNSIQPGSSDYRQYRGLYVGSVSEYTFRTTEGEVPDASSVSAYSWIQNGDDEEAYSHVPF